MKKVVIALLAIACVLSVVVFFFVAFLIYKNSTIKRNLILIELEEVSYKSKETMDYKLLASSEFLSKDRVYVRTSESGKAHVILNDNSLLSLNSNSEVVVNSNEVKILKGNVWFRSNGSNKVNEKTLNKGEIYKSNLDDQAWVEANEDFDRIFEENINKSDYLEVIKKDVKHKRSLALSQQFDLSTIVSGITDNLGLLSQYVCKKIQTENFDINDYKNQLKSYGFREEDLIQGEETIQRLKIFCEDNVLTIDEVNSLIK